MSIKKRKGVKRNIVATVSHNEYKNVWLNKKCLMHSMKRTQSKDHKYGAYEINKISLSLMIKYTSKIMDVID